MFFPKSLFFSIPLVILRMEDENDRQFVTELYLKYKLNMYYYLTLARRRLYASMMELNGE